MSPKLPTKLLRRIGRVFRRKCKKTSIDDRETSTATKPMAPPSLPIEIFELIIDFARRDRRTLLNCALVCRAWLWRSRYNLLYSVEIRDLAQLAKFSGMVAGDTRLGAMVKELHVTPYRGQSQAYGMFPVVLGGKLNKLAHLRIDIHRDYYPIGAHDVFSSSISQFSTITSLEIHRVQFPTFHQFALLVSAFPRLTSLSCWMVDWVRKSYDPEAFKAIQGRLQLKHLYMRNVDWSEEMVTWLLSVLSVQKLARIELPVISTRDVEHVGRLLEAVGPSLCHLEIGIVTQNQWQPPLAQMKTVYDYEGDVGTYPRLVHNTGLTSLHLDLYGGGNWASGILSQVLSPISSVTIRLPPNRKPTKIKHYHCRPIDAALALPQFDRLERIAFEYDKSMDIERLSWFMAEIPARFPLSHARRLVQFQGVTRDWWDS